MYLTFWLIFSDYREQPELDNYERAGLDDDDYDAMNIDQRRAAERELHQDEVMRERGKARAPAAFIDDEELSGDEQYARRGQARMMRSAEEAGEDGEFDNVANVNDYGEAKEDLHLWLQKKEVIQYVMKSFSTFIRNYQVKGVHTYENRIQDMCRMNKQSFEVNFTDLASKQPNLAIWLAEEPTHMLPILNSVAGDIVSEIFPDYSDFH